MRRATAAAARSAMFAQTTSRFPYIHQVKSPCPQSLPQRPTVCHLCICTNEKQVRTRVARDPSRPVSRAGVLRVHDFLSHAAARQPCFGQRRNHASVPKRSRISLELDPLRVTFPDNAFESPFRSTTSACTNAPSSKSSRTKGRLQSIMLLMCPSIPPL